MSSENQYIGKNIRLFRKQAKLTQEQLAEQSGLSVKYISLLETGASNNITIQKLKKIAIALHTDLSTIVKEDLYAKNSFTPQIELLIDQLKQLPDYDAELLSHYFLDGLATIQKVIDKRKKNR